MEKVTLGKTGLCVKRLGFGGIPIQRVSESQAVEIVRHAVPDPRPSYSECAYADLLPPAMIRPERKRVQLIARWNERRAFGAGGGVAGASLSASA